jgi:hypothetical protein
MMLVSDSDWLERGLTFQAQFDCMQHVCGLMHAIINLSTELGNRLTACPRVGGGIHQRLHCCLSVLQRRKVIHRVCMLEQHIIVLPYSHVVHLLQMHVVCLRLHIFVVQRLCWLL